jgi:glycosyltransferase 2 family protein
VTLPRAIRPDSFAPLVPALRLVGFALAVALVAAMAVLAARSAQFDSVTWWPLGPALGAAVVWWALLARGWAILASGRANRPDVGVWCRTQVLRYLPGGIWAPTSRVVLVGGSAVDRLATVAAENVVSLCAALAVGGVAFAASGRPAWALLALAAAVPPAATRLARGRTRLDPARVRRATANGLAAFACYVPAAVLVQAAVSGWHRPLAVAGAAAIAWAAGLVVVFTPGGLGTREVAYVALLTPVFARGDLAAAAVVMRATTIAAELLVLLAAGRPAGAGPRPAAGEPAPAARSEGPISVPANKVPS